MAFEDVSIMNCCVRETSSSADAFCNLTCCIFCYRWPLPAYPQSCLLTSSHPRQKWAWSLQRTLTLSRLQCSNNWHSIQTHTVSQVQYNPQIQLCSLNKLNNFNKLFSVASFSYFVINFSLMCNFQKIAFECSIELFCK